MPEVTTLTFDRLTANLSTLMRATGNITAAGVWVAGAGQMPFATRAAKLRSATLRLMSLPLVAQFLRPLTKERLHHHLLRVAWKHPNTATSEPMLANGRDSSRIPA